MFGVESFWELRRKYRDQKLETQAAVVFMVDKLKFNSADAFLQDFTIPCRSIEKSS